MNRVTLNRRAALLGLSLSSALTGPVRGQQEPVNGKEPPVLVPVAPRNAVTLENGVRLAVVEVPDATITAVDVFFLVGLVDELRFPGVNSLIARTWGSDTEFRMPTLLQTDIARVGALGTDISEDWTELWGLAGKDEESLRRLLQTMLTNIVANSLFPPDVVANGREAQRGAIALAQDDLYNDALERLRGRVFARSPYGLPLFGNEASLGGLTTETVQSYYDRHFRPERCVISVAGPLKQETVKALVEACMSAGGWSDRTPAPPVPRVPTEQIPEGLRDSVLPRSLPGAVVAVGYLAPGTATPQGQADHATLLLLNAVLGGGKSSRLFTFLRESQKPVGYDVISQVMARRAQSLWVVYATGAADPLVCRDALRGECLALASGERPVTEDELKRAKTYLIARHLKDRQRTRLRAFGAGWAEIMGLGMAFDVEFEKQLEGVSVARANALAARIFAQPSAAVYSPASDAG